MKDIVVAGAGCAGLSVALALLERGVRARIVLVDPRTRFERDRTWCHFELEPHRFSAAVTHRWNRVRIAHPAGTRTLRVARTPYCHLPADAVYRAALDRLARAPNVSLRLGERVLEIEDRAGAPACVRTDRGELRADLVFDSRPVRPPSAPGDLVQSFAGWFVRTDLPVFDPRTATLMDLRVPQQGGVHFIYVLPFSETEALVEDTWFASQPLPIERHETFVADWLAAAGVHGYSVLAREQGVLPMARSPFTLQPSPRVVHVGLRGGAARPSTGYAFVAIQRHASALAAWVARGMATGRWGAAPAPRAAHVGWLDRVFLARLTAHPERGAELFHRLFARVPSDRLVRFLSESFSVRDALSVMMALPFGPFARQALRELAPRSTATLAPRADRTSWP
ncbi:MAG: lycopene cyclase family protein [Myxococcota bacterium]|nr:lycopene cyclase family protein [Myxococcota bacterium]MDW8362103.1 lycopene cyclase family protein [Myxococcales bacterium]